MPISKLREQTFFMLDKYREIINPKEYKILDVGVAGDPPRPDGKPGGNYKFFGEGNEYRTLDISEQFNPDYVYDICDTGFDNDTWDVIIVSQVLEHTKKPSKVFLECNRILKPTGYLIIDSPWNYHYHPEHNYDDYWRVSIAGLKMMAENADFYIQDANQTNYLSSILCRPNKK